MLFDNLAYALQSHWRYLVDVLSIKGVWLNQERGGGLGVAWKPLKSVEAESLFSAMSLGSAAEETFEF